MNTLAKLLPISFLATTMTIAVLSPAVAAENQNSACDDGATVKLGQMGTVNEEAIQKHIDKMKLQMKNIRHGRGSHVSRKREIKQHLSQMQAAVQEMHDQKYAAGCKQVMANASAATRIEVMEKRMDMMQQMMKQVIENLSEQSK